MQQMGQMARNSASVGSSPGSSTKVDDIGPYWADFRRQIGNIAMFHHRDFPDNKFVISALHMMAVALEAACKAREIKNKFLKIAMLEYAKLALKLKENHGTEARQILRTTKHANDICLYIQCPMGESKLPREQKELLPTYVPPAQSEDDAAPQAKRRKTTKATDKPEAKEKETKGAARGKAKAKEKSTQKKAQVAKASPYAERKDEEKEEEDRADPALGSPSCWWLHELICTVLEASTGFQKSEHYGNVTSHNLMSLGLQFFLEGELQVKGRKKVRKWSLARQQLLVYAKPRLEAQLELLDKTKSVNA